MEDDFAQSREPDDLFADEIEPADEKVVSTSHTSAPKITPHPPHVESSSTQPQSQVPNERPSNHRGGRGGRGGRGNRNVARETNNSTHVPVAASPQRDTVETPVEPTSTEDVQPPPPVDQEQRITSVRGDRSASGPARPTKKTEAELTELMSSMRLKNAAKAEAHERAEKDQASFLQREKAAELKRVEQSKALKEQERERAKNRERKIKAQGGREWDSEKQESDIVDRRGNSSSYMRGAHGGVSSRTGGGLAASQYNDQEPGDDGGGRGRDPLRSRGRGGRGGRGNRDRGKAGSDGNAFSTNPLKKPSDSDFPALPVVPSTLAKEPPTLKAGPGESSTWAEEMEIVEPVVEKV